MSAAEQIVEWRRVEPELTNALSVAECNLMACAIAWTINEETQTSGLRDAVRNYVAAKKAWNEAYDRTHGLTVPNTADEGATGAGGPGERSILRRSVDLHVGDEHHEPGHGIRPRGGPWAVCCRLAERGYVSIESCTDDYDRVVDAFFLTALGMDLAVTEGLMCPCETDKDDPGSTHLASCRFSDPNYCDGGFR